MTYLSDGSASMKGGRTAPRNPNPAKTLSTTRPRFNEGGADCPPKPSAQAEHSQQASRFNEGGADCPPKHVPAPSFYAVIRVASMKGGRTAPRNFAVQVER